ncbi:MAG TPA: alpha/beta hydrolase [Stellaceae bacterium]|nr:alpha/beta hydrolase [Stellaceae bacterium]
MQQEAHGHGARKGPRVFLDYSQAELDAAYDQSMYASNQEQLQNRRIANSAAARRRLGDPERFAYGPTEIERLDVFRTRGDKAPIFVFIHGGAWRAGLAKDHAYAAETFVRAGVHFVVPDFVLVQDAGRSLMPMAQQVRSAIAWVYRNAARFGGDPDRLYLGGHSSGAHLAGCALVTDWQKDFGLDPGFLKGVTLCSGMYDLKGPRLSARSNYVDFTDEMEEALSAMRHIDRIQAPLVLGYGTCETPEFQRQGRDFHAAVKAAGKKVELFIGEYCNHFEMAETLANPYGPFGRAVLEQMEISLIPA